MADEVQTLATPGATPPAAVTPPAAGAPPAAAPVTPPAATGGEAPPAAAAQNTGDTPPATPPADNANWRKDLAGDDEKTLALLERIPSQKDLLKSWLEQKALIAAGKHKEPLGKDATPEQIAEYRKANGIPENAEDYYKTLPEGIVFGEDDKPGVTKFLQDMHGLNAPPAMVSKALEVFVAAQAEGAQLRSDMDVKARDETSEALRQEWGPDYKANVNAMSAFVTANIPAEAQADFLNARMGDGTPVFSHPAMVRAFAQLGRTLNPTGTTTPGGGMDKMDAIEDAIKGYEKRMATDRANWFKDEKSQSHYRELLTARERMTKKKA
jgi:hypothetical protein